MNCYQEFNKFNELWDAMFKSQTNKEKALEAKKEDIEKVQQLKEEATDESIKEKQN